MASPITAADRDHKGVRDPSPSISSGSGRDGMSNVVDHLAPGVTEHVHHVPKRQLTDKIISVQPLRKDEMQVRPAIALILANSSC